MAGTAVLKRAIVKKASWPAMGLMKGSLAYTSGIVVGSLVGVSSSSGVMTGWPLHLSN